MSSNALRHINSIRSTARPVFAAVRPFDHPFDYQQLGLGTLRSKAPKNRCHQRSMGSTTQLSASVSAADAATASQTASNAAASAAASAAEAKEMSRIATEKAAAASSAATEAAAYAAQAQQASAAAALQNGNASSNSQLPLLLVVGVALLRSNSPRPGASVLLAQRPPGKANAGLWEFPGGKVSHV